jgi:nicotinate-nucleotide adenylyltransferase
MNKIAIFGGAFDPPHKGHQEIVHCLLNRHGAGMNYVEIVPSGVHRHKGIIKTPPEHRIGMIAELFRGMPQLNISDIEIKQDMGIEGAGSTFNLMNNMSQHWKDISEKVPSLDEYDLYCVLGQDNADNIKSFYNWEKLLSDFKFIVFPRYGKDVADSPDAWYMKEPHIFLKCFEPVDISSSEIRKGLHQEMIPERVLAYIKSNQLYDLIKK